MSSDDNVIPFPGASLERTPEELAREAVDELLRRGKSPQDILDQVLGAAPGLDLPRPRDPELLTPAAEPATYVVRVDVDGARPPIWRRLHLASDLTLDRVHEVLQAAMGWWNSHLHQFVMGPGARDHQVAPFLTDFDISEGDEGIAEAEVRLDQVLASPGDRLHYTYDFGDGWDHTLRLEAAEPRGDGPPARCVGGRRACPPEDVGGIYRYNDVAERLVTPGFDDIDEGMADVLAWLPPGFDPTAFDPAAADGAVAGALLTEAELAAGLPANPALAELAARLDLPGLRSLGELVTLAGLDSDDTVDHAAAMRPLLVLLERAGGDGADLTDAGWLRPEIVKELLSTLAWDAPWLGKGNREVNCPPIRHLRAAAQGTGLVRRHRGRLVLTPAGRRVDGDPQALWDHVADRLPVGRHEWERSAGALALLAVAAGGRDTFDLFAPGLLADARWAVAGRPPNEWAAFEWARPTWEVFWALTDDRGALREAPPVHVPALARAALTSARPE